MMPFDHEAERVLYEKNPLDAVVCQLKFPTILRVESELPSDFQDRIRGAFPLFNETPAGQMPIQLPIPAEIAKILGRQLDAATGRKYSFVSEDKSWQVSLSRESLALTCRKYIRWETFEDRLRTPLFAFSELYRPSFFSRVALRYRNLIRRSALGIAERPWSALLRTEIAGELAAHDMSQNISMLRKEILFDLRDGMQARMLQGFVMINGEQAYMIDTDFFSTQKTEVDYAWQRLGTFNKYARWIFRRCISDELHSAMGPRPIQ